jgi:hypothetical protein
MGLPENYLRFFMNLKYVLDFNFPLVVGCFSDCVLLNLNVLHFMIWRYAAVGGLPYF